MSVHLAVNINDMTHRVFDEALFERDLTPEAVLQVGVYVLGLMEKAKRIELVDKDGIVTQVKHIELRMPAPPHDIDDFNLRLIQSGSSAVFFDHEII